jgi:hypothetical protein
VGEMTDNSRLVEDLREARTRMRGDVLRGKVKYECSNGHCPVITIVMAFVERLGHGRPMQPPARCPRCAQVLEYLELFY